MTSPPTPLIFDEPAPWMERGACIKKGHGPFFPEERGRPGSEPRSAPAKAMCHGCPVKRDCLEYAIKHNEYGVWGETTRHERAQLVKLRRLGLVS